MIMKQLVITFALSLASAVAVAALHNPISIGQLPEQAREFMERYFPDAKPLLVRQEGGLVHRDYEVVLTDGTEIEFSSAGVWREVSLRSGTIPAELIPAGVAGHLAQHYPDVEVRKIERRRRTFEVELSNGLELTFDKRCRLTDVDD